MSRSPLSPLRLLVALGFLGAAWPGAAFAAAPAPSQAPSAPTAAPLSALLEEAAAHHPGVRQARARYEAARARVAGEGLRPDPMVEAGAMSLWGLMGPEVSVSQTFPLGGKLEARRRAAESEVGIAHQAYRLALNALLVEVKRTYFDLATTQAAEAIVARNRQLLTQLSKIAAARYAVGQGKQSDVLRTNTQLAELMSEAVALRQQREALSARLAGLLNRPGGQAVTAQAVGAIAPAPRPVAELEAAAEARHPGLLRARAELEAGEAALAEAHTLGTPDVTARLGLMRSYMDMGWETTVSGMVGTNLPLQSARREAAAVSAAEAEIAARRAAIEDQRRELTAAIHRYAADARNLAERVKLYEQGLLPQARQAHLSELANYQVGRSDFDAVLSAQLALYRYEREHQQALAEHHQAIAELGALGAEGLPLSEEMP